jgi:serine/threonine protein phosphatase 1
MEEDENKTYFGITIFENNLVKEDDIKNLPFYDFFNESMKGSTYLVRDGKGYIYLTDFEQFCLYKRYKQFDNKDIFNIYGHAVRSEVKITSFDCNIDLGCCYKGTDDAVSNPRLCALEFPSMKIYTQENLEN